MVSPAEWSKKAIVAIIVSIGCTCMPGLVFDIWWAWLINAVQMIIFVTQFALLVVDSLEPQAFLLTFELIAIYFSHLRCAIVRQEPRPVGGWLCQCLFITLLSPFYSDI